MTRYYVNNKAQSNGDHHEQVNGCVFCSAACHTQ
jgi:hypothetical protein